jgi:hypothetical protein
MRCFVESIFDCSADKVWEKVQTSSLLFEVMRPLIWMAPVDAPAFPERWVEETSVRGVSYLFGVIPLGTHTLFFERIDPEAREIQSREFDPIVRRWDHLVQVEALEDGRSRYSDEIEIEAGWLTVAVWLFANVFYRHRQRRWRKIARRLAGSEQTLPGSAALQA